MWTILGCAAGQDTVFGLCPYKTWYTILCASSPTGYGQYDRHSISLFCPKHGQGVKPSESPLHPNIDQKSPFLLSPPPPGSGSTLQSATKYLWPKLRNTVIPEQNAITLSARAVKKAT